MNLDPIVEWVDELPAKDGRELRDPTAGLFTLYELAKSKADGRWAKTLLKPQSRGSFVDLGERNGIVVEAVTRGGFVYVRKPLQNVPGGSR